MPERNVLEDRSVDRCFVGRLDRAGSNDANTGGNQGGAGRLYSSNDRERLRQYMLVQHASYHDRVQQLLRVLQRGLPQLELLFGAGILFAGFHLLWWNLQRSLNTR